jgi:hypothetical protein
MRKEIDFYKYEKIRPVLVKLFETTQNRNDQYLINVLLKKYFETTNIEDEIYYMPLANDGVTFLVLLGVTNYGFYVRQIKIDIFISYKELEQICIYIENKPKYNFNLNYQDYSYKEVDFFYIREFQRLKDERLKKYAQRILLFNLEKERVFLYDNLNITKK